MVTLSLCCGALISCRAKTAGDSRAAASAHQDSPRDSAAWWIDTYGTAPAAEPVIQRAHAVFERVAAAADKRNNRLPRLVVLEGKLSPHAMAIRDGTVLVTRDALDLCYGRERQLPVERGDARLAFVLGHELAHMANDHFWHGAAFATVMRDNQGGAGDGSRPTLAKYLEQGHIDIARSELQADEMGLLYLSMAAFDPRGLVEGDASFFDEWMADLPQAAAVAADPQHPSPAERARFLRQRLSEVADEVPLFHFGTRLLQRGQYRDAILLLERFAESYPGREVLNNLGLAHFQLALQHLGACDGALLTRYRLPTAIDAQTLAERTVRRGGTGYSSPCLQDPAFRAESRASAARLEAAEARDPLYLPARLNQIALALVSDQPARALAAAEASEALAPEDPEVQVAAALALHVYGVRSNFDTADRALAELESVLARHPRHGVALYNRAVLLAERRRSAAAQEAWRRFLDAEPEGPYAAVARGWLGLPVPRGKPKPAPSVAPPGSLWPLGPISATTAARLARARERKFVIGDLRGAIYEAEGWRALRLGDAIEITEPSTRH